jgi:hypothetical protein
MTPKLAAILRSPNRWLSHIVSIVIAMLVQAAAGASSNTDLYHHLRDQWALYLISIFFGAGAGQAVTVYAAQRELCPTNKQPPTSP